MALFASPPGEGPKIIKFQLQSRFQRFLNQTLCIFSQMKDINISDEIFIRSSTSCPRGEACCKVVVDSNLLVHVVFSKSL